MLNSLLEGVPLLLPDHGLLVHVVDTGALVLHPQDDGDVGDRSLQQRIPQLATETGAAAGDKQR